MLQKNGYLETDHELEKPDGVMAKIKRKFNVDEEGAWMKPSDREGRATIEITSTQQDEEWKNES